MSYRYSKKKPVPRKKAPRRQSSGFSTNDMECFRCGHKTHLVADCYAKKDRDGRKL